MDAIHGAADVAGTLAGEEGVEGDEGLGLGAGGVEERGCENVHPLNIGTRLRGEGGVGGRALGREG